MIRKWSQLGFSAERQLSHRSWTAIACMGVAMVAGGFGIDLVLITAIITGAVYVPLPMFGPIIWIGAVTGVVSVNLTLLATHAMDRIAVQRSSGLRPPTSSGGVRGSVLRSRIRVLRDRIADWFRCRRTATAALLTAGVLCTPHIASARLTREDAQRIGNTFVVEASAILFPEELFAWYLRDAWKLPDDACTVMELTLPTDALRLFELRCEIVPTRLLKSTSFFWFVEDSPG